MRKATFSLAKGGKVNKEKMSISRIKLTCCFRVEGRNESQGRRSWKLEALSLVLAFILVALPSVVEDAVLLGQSLNKPQTNCLLSTMHQITLIVRTN